MTGNRPQLRGDGLGADRPELEHLGTRQDRLWDLPELGRGHHEHDMGWGLLDRLEQRVERMARQLVKLVDDENFVSIPNRRRGQPGDDDLANTLDLGVGSGVDFEHIDVAALCDLDALVTLAAGIWGWAVLAIESSCKNACRSRLTNATWPGKHERLCEPGARDRVAQRLCDTALSDNVLEPLGSILPRKNLVGHLSNRSPSLSKGPTAARKDLRHRSVTT